MRTKFENYGFFEGCILELVKQTCAGLSSSKLVLPCIVLTSCFIHQNKENNRFKGGKTGGTNAQGEPEERREKKQVMRPSSVHDREDIARLKILEMLQKSGSAFFFVAANQATLSRILAFLLRPLLFAP